MSVMLSQWVGEHGSARTLIHWYMKKTGREKKSHFLAEWKCYISQLILDIKCSCRPCNEMYSVSSSRQTFEDCFHFTNTAHYTFWWTPWVTATRGYGKIRRKKFNVDFGGQLCSGSSFPSTTNMLLFQNFILDW